MGELGRAAPFVTEQKSRKNSEGGRGPCEITAIVVEGSSNKGMFQDLSQQGAIRLPEGQTQAVR